MWRIPVKIISNRIAIAVGIIWLVEVGPSASEASAGRGLPPELDQRHKPFAVRVEVGRKVGRGWLPSPTQATECIHVWWDPAVCC